MNRWRAMWPYFVVGSVGMLMGDWMPRWVEWAGWLTVWVAVWLFIGEWARNKFMPQRRHNDRGNR